MEGSGAHPSGAPPGPDGEAIAPPAQPARVTLELLAEYPLGDLDPGVVLHLMQQKGMSAKALVDLLCRRSGVLGLSGISSDLRELLGSDNLRARFAVEVFCYRVARHARATVRS